jgi:two-component system response regulator AtoC
VQGRSALILESDPTRQQQLCEALEALELAPVVAASTDELLVLAYEGPYQLTVVGLHIDGQPGLEVLRRIRSRQPHREPLIMLADGDHPAPAAVADALDADQILPWPWTAENFAAAVERALERPRAPVGDGIGYDDAGTRLRQEMALWRSAKMREVWRIVHQAAGVDVTVLIGGETGTGKELVARAIHHLSPRRSKPFVKVNCAAVPAELLESELFGHERGAFTGAHQLRVGKFEAADQGVVFLDEIGDLHLSLQAKLLHVLQDGAFTRVGGRATIKVDVRVVAATNRDLERDVAEGRFREDLYYRLNVIQVCVPPLRERAEEVAPLAEYFLQRYARVYRREGFAVSPPVLERLVRHDYPGNVRELENIVKRMVVLNDPLLERTALGPRRGPAEELPASAAAGAAGQPSLKDIARAAARAAEREAIARVLHQTRWNRVRAAKLLGISYRALLYKIKDAGLAAESSLPSGS